MAMSFEYLTYNAMITVFPFGNLILLICQLFADKYGKYKLKDSITRILLYGIYISGLICTTIGYTLHHSKKYPSWCKLYGFPPCFAVYASAKSFLLGFFLCRAKKANKDSLTNNKWKRLFFERIAPIYIFIYFITYLVLIILFFKGEAVDIDNANKIGSYCLFNSYNLWFILFADIIDIFNCVTALLLFVLPLLHSINKLNMKENQNVNDVLLLKFIKTLKWNVFLSFIATVMSIITLSSVPFTEEYIWFFCTGDPFINSIAAFLMVASNRQFVANQCCKCCLYESGQNEEATSSLTNVHDITGHNSYKMETILTENVGKKIIHSKSTQSAHNGAYKISEAKTDEINQTIKPTDVSIYDSSMRTTSDLPTLQQSVTKPDISSTF